MGFRTVRYPKYSPLSEYRWIYRDCDWNWHLREPPDNFAAREYESQALRPYEPTDKFYLVAPFLRNSPEVRAELKEEPELYLQFASTLGTADSILEYANKFGPLSRQGGEWIQGHQAPDIWRAFCGSENALWSSIHLIAEPAFAWLRLFQELRSATSRWSELAVRPVEERKKFLDQIVGGKYRSPPVQYTEGNHLELRVDVDPDSGKPFSEIIASNLIALVWVQWGLSVAAGVHHRQCDQCEKLFVVRAGEGRLDKRFCSVNCRMRGFRLRKRGSAVTRSA
jgi:hypothetical protein